MKGPIIDSTVRIRPAKSLIEFICSLDECKEMPENVYRIYKEHIKDVPDDIRCIHEKFIAPKKPLSDWGYHLKKWVDVNDEISEQTNILPNFLDILLDCEDDQPDLDVIQEERTDDEDNDDADANKKKSTERGNSKGKPAAKNKKENSDFSAMLEIDDLRWLDQILKDRRAKSEYDQYLHELLAEAKLVLPQNHIIPRNPELEARCELLREEQKTREYRSMTKNVDQTRQHLPEDTIAYQMKSINRQLVAVLQFVFSVAAGFLFGFQGLQYMFGDLDFGFRLLMGIICSLIIALAEIYFLAKKLNEYDEIIEDIPMPPRQEPVNQPNPMQEPLNQAAPSRKRNTRPHQD